ncbi:MAG: redoxin domain-containing protein [Longimicrobiales bacterium]
MNRRNSCGPKAILAPGTPAPSFCLSATPDQAIDFHEYRGGPVVLAFYPADWSPVCGDQLAILNEVLSDIREHGAELIGISVDGVWCHSAFANHRNLHFPLLSDFEPKGAVARMYGAYSDADGCCSRALFVIDAAGVIRWSHHAPMDVNPGANGILAALDAIAVPSR